MHKILIVDDEKIIREGIGETFEKSGLFQVFYAENGIDALKQCQDNSYDVILIDVLMPGMNGLELLKELDRKGDTSIKIILSAYDDFEYVREAMINRAIDYLRKPLYPKDIERLIMKLDNAVHKRRKRREEYQQLIKTVEESKDIIRQRFFENLLNGWLDEEDVQRRKDLLGDDLQHDNYCVVLLKFIYGPFEREINHNEYQAWLMTISNTIETIVCKYKECIYFNGDLGTFIFLFGINEEEVFQNILDNLMNDARSSLDDLNITICGGIGGMVKDLTQIKFSYQEAHAALKYNVSFSQQSVLSISDIQPSRVRFRSLLDEETFISDLKLGNKAMIASHFNNIENTLQHGDSDMSFIELFLSKVLLNSMMVLLDTAPEENRFISQQYYDVISELNKIVSFREKISKVKEIVEHIADTIESKREDQNSKVIEKIKKYILDHYNEDIQLENIAECVYLSKNYVSQLFRKEVNMSIIDYIHRIRIAKAKELLENTDYKIYEISEMVGYSDQHYFSSVFKRICGISPSDYREFI